MLRLKACFLTVVVFLAAVFTFLPPRTSSQTSVVRVTNTPEQAVNLNPSLSDDGRVVVFESSANFADGGAALAIGVSNSFHAVRADVRGDSPPFQELGATRAISPAVSSDGSVVAFASTEDLVGENADRNSEIFLWSGSGLQQITDTLPDSSATRLIDGNFQPSITANGGLVAFTSRGNLLLFDVTKDTLFQLTEDRTTTVAKISGDGSCLYYQQGSDLVLLGLKTNTTRVVVADVPKLSIATGRAVSNDGFRLVYSAETAPNQTQVFLFDARANTSRQLTQLGTRSVDVALHPTISGDGKRVAFATRRRVTNASDGSVELYVYDIPSGQTVQVTNAPSGASAEVVSSLNFDGSLVAFSFPRLLSGPATDNDLGNNNEIYLASLASRLEFGTATVLNTAALGNEPAQPAPIAPGSLATIRGNALAFRIETGISANPPFTLAGTTVKVNGQAARIFFASPEEIVFIVPEALSDGPAEVVVTNADGFSSRAETVIANAAPGIFTVKADGTGEAIVLDSDTQTEGPFDPSNRQLRLSIFATGVRHAHDVSASINGQAALVETIVSGGLPGLDEVHIVVPAELRGAGPSPLVVTADGVQSNPVTLTIDGSALRDIVINEILADPPDGLAGDANHDGIRDTADDEFIELVNSTTRDLDLSGYELQTRSLTSTTDTLRHRFAPNTLLPAGTALIIFGGGSPDNGNPAFGGAQVVTASRGGLSLTNSGAVVTLRNATGEIVTSVAYGSTLGLRGDLNQSLTRTPEVTGTLSLHSTAPGSENRNFSPGTKLDGSPFIRVTPTPTPTPSPTPAPSPTPTPTPTPNPTPTQTPTPTPTPSPTPIPTPTPNPTPTPTPSPSPFPSPSPGPTVTPSPTPSPSPTATPTPSPSPSPAPTATPTPLPSPSPSPTATPTPSPSPTATPIPSPSPTPSATPIPTPSISPTPAPTPTATPTPSPSPTPTPSPSPLPSPTVTPTPSPSPTATPIPSPSPSPTATPIPTPTISPTPSPTPTATPTPSPTPLPETSPNIVISQVFGGGGNANSPFRNDFIEIFNRGTTPVNLSGWSVQYASATAATWSVTPLTSITLQPGQYYLVQQASAGNNGAPLPSPDATGTIAMAATAGKVALVRSVTPLSGTCPNNPDIVDLVGYGSTASCFRGAAPAPAPSNTNAISRAENGCTNTHNNNADFKTNPPNPRNIASPVNMCPELSAAFETLKHALSLRRSHFPSHALRLRQLPRRPT